MSKKSIVKQVARVVSVKPSRAGVASAEDRWNLSARLRPEVTSIPNEHLILDLVASFGRSRREITESLLLFPRNVDCIEDAGQRAAVCAWLGIDEPEADERVQYVKDQVSRSSSGGDAWLDLLDGDRIKDLAAYHKLRFKRLDEQVGRGMTQEKGRRARNPLDGLAMKGAMRLDQIEQADVERTPTGLPGLDMLGGQDSKNHTNCGFCVGDLVLVGGSPGIGKSRLLMKMAAIASSPMLGHTVLYNQGEFALSTFKTKYCMGVLKGDEDLYLSEKRSLGDIVDMIYALKPRFVVLDSKDKINECVNQAGWKRTEKRLRKVAADVGATIFIVTHLNQEGGIMGGRSIEHDVDVVMHVRGIPESGGLVEVSIPSKNRSGATGDDRSSIFRHFNREIVCVKEASPYLFKDMDDQVDFKNPLLEGILDSMSNEESILAEEDVLLSKVHKSGMESLLKDERRRLSHITEWRVRKDSDEMKKKLKQQKKGEKEAPEAPEDDGDE